MRTGALVLKRESWERWRSPSPSLVLIAIVIVFPIAYSFWLSFRNFDLAVGPDSEFVVGANYFEALFIMGPALVLELLVGLGLGLLLTRIGGRRPIAAALLPSPPWCRR